MEFRRGVVFEWALGGRNCQVAERLRAGGLLGLRWLRYRAVWRKILAAVEGDLPLCWNVWLDAALGEYFVEYRRQKREVCHGRDSFLIVWNWGWEDGGFHFGAGHFDIPACKNNKLRTITDA